MKTKKIKSKIMMLLVFGLAIGAMLLGTTKINAASNPANAPLDWAFEAGSIGLNDAIVQQYPTLDNGTGFVTKSLANAFTGAISLNGMNIGGTINGIENFTSISSLSLSSNSLTGSIPGGFGALSNLQSLNLGANQLSGGIPVSIGQLSNLQDLSLDNNQLSGEIPVSIGQLSNLQGLFLTNNQLSGEIPTSLGNLTNLKYLYIGGNKLSGEISESIIQLNNLEEIALNYNQFTSISQATYNFITSRFVYGIVPQTYTVNQTIPVLSNTDYEFEGLPAYEQFPNYGTNFTYTLNLPDGTSKVISPVISNGMVKISGSELTQIGAYSLVAYGVGGFLDTSVYTTNFRIEEGIDFLSVIANGKEDKETSTKITIELSKIPVVGELTVDDISIASQTGASITINKDTLISLGNGMYELAVNGTWDEGTIIDVTVEKDGTVFNPDTRSTVLHKAKTDTGGTTPLPEKPGSTENIGTIKTLPQTGDSNTPAAILMLISGLLVSSGYLVTNRKELK